MLLRYSGYNSSSTRSSNETDRDCSTRGLVAQDLYLYCSHAFLKGTESHNRIPVALALPLTYPYRHYCTGLHEHVIYFETKKSQHLDGVYLHKANRDRNKTNPMHRASIV